MKIDILFSTEFTRFTKSFKITKFILIGNLRNYEGHFLKTFLMLLQIISKHRSNFHKDCSEGIPSLVLEKILKVGLIILFVFFMRTKVAIQHLPVNNETLCKFFQNFERNH